MQLLAWHDNDLVTVGHHQRYLHHLQHHPQEAHILHACSVTAAVGSGSRLQ